MAKSGLLDYSMQNLMDIMVRVVSELSDGPKSSNLGSQMAILVVDF